MHTSVKSMSIYILETSTHYHHNQEEAFSTQFITGNNWKAMELFRRILRNLNPDYASKSTCNADIACKHFPSLIGTKPYCIARWDLSS